MLVVVMWLDVRTSWSSGCHRRRLRHLHLLHQNPGWFDILVTVYRGCYEDRPLKQVLLHLLSSRKWSNFFPYYVVVLQLLVKEKFADFCLRYYSSRYILWAWTRTFRLVLRWPCWRHSIETPHRTTSLFSSSGLTADLEWTRSTSTTWLDELLRRRFLIENSKRWSTSTELKLLSVIIIIIIIQTLR